MKNSHRQAVNADLYARYIGTAPKHHTRHNQSYSGNQSHFDKALLPTPADYLQSMNFKVSKSGSYLMICCPFHGEQNPSLGMNRDQGYYKCFSCGAKGGDILSFHMRLREIGFVEACKQLGAWTGD